MALFTQDWTDLDYLPWGWMEPYFSTGDFVLSSNGLNFTSTNNYSGVYYNKELFEEVGTSEIDGTQIVSFKIDKVNGSAESRIISICLTAGPDAYSISPYLKATITGGSNLSLTITHNKNFFNQEILVGEVGIYSKLAGSTGSIESTFETDGTIGTRTSRLFYGGETLGAVTCTVNPDWYEPSEGTKYTHGHMGRKVYGADCLYITSATYLSELIGAAPLVLPTFYYSGYYNNGSSQGNYNLSANVLSISPIQDAIRIPGNASGFSAEVTVILDNSSGQWGTFTGYASSGTVYNPPGIFYVRDLYIQGASIDLFQGFADYNSLTFNDLNKTVTLKLESVVSMLTKYPLITAGFVGSSTRTLVSASDYSLNNSLWGTVHSVVGNYGEEGTLIVKSIPRLLELAKGDMVVQKNSDNVFFIGSFIDSQVSSGTYYGTYTFAARPSWLSSGVYLTCNKSVVSESLTLKDFYDTQFKYPITFTWVDLYGGAANPPNWDISNTSRGVSDIYYSPNFTYRGDETGLEVLTDITNSTGGFFSYFQNGMNIFTPSLEAMTAPVNGTINYQTECYGGVNYVQNFKTKELNYTYAYDDDSKKYNLAVNLKLSNDTDGDIINLKTRLVKFTVDASEISYIVGLFYNYNIVLSLMLDSSKYITCTPGKIVTIENTPSTFQIATSRFLVTSRTFDPASKMISCQFLGIPNLASNFFRVSVDSIGGTVGII